MSAGGVSFLLADHAPGTRPAEAEDRAFLTRVHEALLQKGSFVQQAPIARVTDGSEDS